MSDYLRKHESILIIDDEEEIGEILNDIFKNIFQKVTYCSNSLEALALVEKNYFSIIITDYSMPQLSGYEFVKKMRLSNNLTPVIFLTGHASKDLQAAASYLGDVVVQEKPFEEKVLIENVGKSMAADKRKLNNSAQFKKVS